MELDRAEKERDDAINGAGKVMLNGTVSILDNEPIHKVFCNGGGA